MTVNEAMMIEFQKREVPDRDTIYHLFFAYFICILNQVDYVVPLIC